MRNLCNEHGGAAYGTMLSILVTVGIGAGITVLTQQSMGGGDFDSANPLGGGLQDRVFQGKTIADMKAIATATMAFYLREGRYPEDMDELGESSNMQNFTSTDMWGNPWRYEANDRHFVLLSVGADGKRGPKPPANWDKDDYAPDLIIRDGEWLQAPASALGRVQHSLTSQSDIADKLQNAVGR